MRNRNLSNDSHMIHLLYECTKQHEREIHTQSFHSISRPSIDITTNYYLPSLHCVTTQY